MVMVDIDGILCEATVVKVNKWETRYFVFIPFYYSQYKQEYRAGKANHLYKWVDKEKII